MVAIKQFIPPQYCLSCRQCCRFAEVSSAWTPRLLEEEKKTIGKIELVADAQENNYVCCFLNKATNKCRIYQARPFECALYPFLLNKRGKKVFLSLDTNCPAVNELSGTEEFAQYTRALLEFLRSPSCRAVFANNPGYIQTYETVKDIAEIVL